MGSSGIVFVVIVALWAAYLVPQWLRRREQLTVSQSVGRSSHALRVLMRRAGERGREVRPSTRPVVERPAIVVRTSHDTASVTATMPAEPVAPQRVRARPAAAVAARRRQRALTTLVCLTVVLWVVTSVAAAPVALAIAPTVLLVAFVGSLVVSGHQRLARTRTDRQAPAVRGDRLAQAAHRIEHRVLEELRRTDQAEAEPESIPATIDLRDQVVAHDEAMGEDGTWVPVPVPSPTYMLKPAAPRRLVAPYVHPEAPPAAQAEVDRVVDVREYDVDEALARRRASGE